MTCDGTYHYVFFAEQDLHLSPLIVDRRFHALMLKAALGWRAPLHAPEHGWVVKHSTQVGA